MRLWLRVGKSSFLGKSSMAFHLLLRIGTFCFCSANFTMSFFQHFQNPSDSSYSTSGKNKSRRDQTDRYNFSRSRTTPKELNQHVGATSFYEAVQQKVVKLGS